MKILIVASYNKKRFAPFIVEQANVLKDVGCQIEWFGVQGKGLVGYLRELPRLRKQINSFCPDVVHAHYGLSCLLANLATRKVPVVSTYHGSDINVQKILRFSKIAMRLSAHNIFVSKRNVNIALRLCANSSNDLKDVRDLKDGAAGKYTLLPCGVNLTDDQLLSRSEARKILGIDEQAQIILFAGAFDNHVKDAPLAKEAVEQYLNANSNKVLKDLKDLNNSALCLLELRGYNREQVNHLMCAANCLLMTSKTEGSPQVIKEAMACGCPIVSVDVGDVAERVSGIEGCYVVPSREPKDIAVALQKAIAFQGKTSGRERIIEMGLSNEQIAKRLVEIYDAIV